MKIFTATKILGTGIVVFLGLTMWSNHLGPASAIAPIKMVHAHPMPITSTVMAPVTNWSRIVFLTIDDGPSPTGTPAVLKILQSAGVRATFFVIGRNAEAYPALLKAMYRQGNAIGNHSWDHDYVSLYRSPYTALADFAHGARVIHRILGIWPDILRAPGGTWGNFTPETFALLQSRGYRIYNWNASVGDSSVDPVPISVEVSRVESQTRGRGPFIVLMHDDHPNTVSALPILIRYFRSRGYQFATLDREGIPKALQAHFIPFRYASWVGPTDRVMNPSWLSQCNTCKNPVATQ